MVYSDEGKKAMLMVKCFVRVAGLFGLRMRDSVTVTASMTCARVSREAFLQKASIVAMGVDEGIDMVMEGVLGLVEAVMTISRRRGIPRVTLAAP